MALTREGTLAIFGSRLFLALVTAALFLASLVPFRAIAVPHLEAIDDELVIHANDVRFTMGDTNAANDVHITDLPLKVCALH